MHDFLSFQAMPPFFNICMVWLYTLSQCIAEKNQLGWNIIIQWRSYALGFCQKLKLISRKGVGHSNPYHTIFHCGIIPSLKTLVESAHHLITLLRYTLPYYSVELYSALIHWCGILYCNTLLGYTQSLHIAEVNPIYLHCRVLSNFNALMSYAES